MQKKRKTIFTAVITALFVLSVSYFAMLAPTTAWYYQENAENFNYSFSFKNFNESFAETIGSATIPLRAATRFADDGEWLFDEVIYVLPLTTTNASTSDLDGIVHVNVTGLATGVRWYAFGMDPVTPTASRPNGEPMLDITTLRGGTSNKGQYKPKLESMLGDFGVTKLDFKNLGETAYEGTYNPKAVSALTAAQAEGILVSANSKKFIYIVFWAEYGDIKSSIQSSTVGTKINTTATITVTAEPYLGKYSTNMKTLTLTNSTSSPVSIGVVKAGCEGATAAAVTLDADTGLYTMPSDGNGTANVPANGSMQIAIPSESQLRVKAPSVNTLSNPTGTICTGDNNNVCAIANMGDNITITIS